MQGDIGRLGKRGKQGEIGLPVSMLWQHNEFVNTLFFIVNVYNRVFYRLIR